MGGIYTKKYIGEAETEIKRHRGIPILMIEHNNDYISQKAVFRCLECKNKYSAILDPLPAISPEYVECPICKKLITIAHLNLNLN